MSTAMQTLVVTDCGLVEPAYVITLDFTGHVPSPHLRFYRSLPGVLIGRHQRFEHEARVDYCRQHGIGLVRRITGGGAVYVDPDQLGWSLVLACDRWRDAGIGALLQGLCRAIGDALGTLGIHASFRAPNDLEVDGRKLASGYIARTDRTLLFHGTLLLDVDIERALCALRVPTEKLSSTGLESARQRLTTTREQHGEIPSLPRIQQAIAESLGRYLDLAPVWQEAAEEKPTAAQIEAVLAVDEPFDARSTAESFWKAPGARLRAKIELDASRGRIGKVFVGGDVIVHPLDLFDRLSERLCGSPLGEVQRRVQQFFAESRTEMLGVGPQDIEHLLRQGLDRLEQQRLFGPSLSQANRLMILDPAGECPAGAILDGASVMLVPYCAKLAQCKWRYRDGCPECGACEVGDAYRLARERGMRVVSVQNYEHLCRTLQELKQQGVQGYVGMCCQHFFIKRHQAFLDAGIPLLLMDVTGANCYELRQEEQAYAGTFQAQARLDVALLQRIMHHKPLPEGE